jgi:hypothetical protein
MSKLETLSQKSGYGSIEDMLVTAGLEPTVPAICMNETCDHTEDMEPDQTVGWCPECSMNTVCSCLKLAGLI